MKELDWIGSSKKDLIQFPMSIRKEMGHALYMAQRGEMHGDAKPLKGFGGAKVLEIVLNEPLEQCILFNFRKLYMCCMLFKRNPKRA
jgi:phage-related protein